MNTITATAIAECNCADMTKMQMANGDVPCHNVDDADQKSDQNNTDTTKCLDCGCGHCKVPSSASILGKSPAADMVVDRSAHMLVNDIIMSNAMLGIYHPPKSIS